MEPPSNLPCFPHTSLVPDAAPDVAVAVCPPRNLHSPHADNASRFSPGGRRKCNPFFAAAAAAANLPSHSA